MLQIAFMLSIVRFTMIMLSYVTYNILKLYANNSVQTTAAFKRFCALYSTIAIETKRHHGDK